MKRIFLCLLATFALALSETDGHCAVSGTVFLVGQDVKSIKDYMAAQKRYSSDSIIQPDGIMAYAAINDLRGLWEPVDHGAGVNDVNQMIKMYPQIRVLQIGLYMRYMLAETVKGSFDQSIDQLGQWIKKTKRQVYLRIGYEFDNVENDYDPKEYIEAYRYIVNRLRKDNVHNVYFVWHSIAWRDDDWPAYAPLKWYPDDSYVDWIGISFFDIKRDAERRIITQIARLKHKPLMIAESSPFKQYTVKDKLKWLSILFEYIQQNNVRFLCYINVDWDALSMFANEQWGDARMQTDPILMKGWLGYLRQFRSGL